VHVVIVGGGFGGLKCALALRGSDVKVTLVDRQNYHLFQPLLYQVATAGLSPADVAVPIRSLFRKMPCLEVRLDEVTGIDPARKVVLLAETGELSYDTLVLATGARHSYFAHPEWETLAPGLKTLDDATSIRARILLAFERAETCKDKAEQDAWLTFVIVGGGPTGVELAGAIAELSRRALSRDFDHIRPERARIILVEAGERVLGSFSPELSDYARGALESMGVEVHCGIRVTDMDASGVRASEETISAKTVVWAAGVQASRAATWLGVEPAANGRVRVDAFLQASESVYVIGDTAFADRGDGKPLPGVAPVAMQQGIYVGQRISGRIPAKQPFRYQDKGNMATIGRHRAVVEIKNFKFRGFFAWFLWLFVHILFLIGFKNRFFVLFQWTWAYLTFQRGARLITGRTRRPDGPPPPDRPQSG
jgi:NADH:ubiquinone reductase (H+-translocating)